MRKKNYFLKENTKIGNFLVWKCISSDVTALTFTYCIWINSFCLVKLLFALKSEFSKWCAPQRHLCLLSNNKACNFVYTYIVTQRVALIIIFIFNAYKFRTTYKLLIFLISIFSAITFSYFYRLLFFFSMKYSTERKIFAVKCYTAL